MIAQYPKVMRWLLWLWAATPLMALDLSPKLVEWKAEIEREGGIPVLIGEVLPTVDGDGFHLSGNVPHRELFSQYLSQPEFAAQFKLMYAVMVSHNGPQSSALLIMVNGARRAEFAGYEDAVVGHELGHAQIKARRYPAPRFLPGVSGCLAISTGDVVQHILIRAEMDRRGIAREPFWIKSLDEASAVMAGSGVRPAGDRCAAVRQAAQLIDVRLGLRDASWPGRERYESQVGRLFPEVEQPVDAVVAYLADKDVTGKIVHQRALEFVFDKLKNLAVQSAENKTPQNRYAASGPVLGRCVNLRRDPGRDGSELYASAWGFPLDTRYGAVQYIE